MPVFSKYKPQEPTNFELFIAMIPVVRKARRNMKDAKKAITAKEKEYHLKQDEPKLAKACFNHFDKVIVDAPETSYVEDTGYKEDCGFLKGRTCTNQYCTRRPLLQNFVNAEERFYKARAEKRLLLKRALGFSK
jgi:hypothetical protein